MKRKQIVFITLAVMLVLITALGACGGGGGDASSGGDSAASSSAPAETSADPAESSSSEAPAEGEAKSIVYAQKSLDYYAWTVMQAGVEKVAKDKGWNFEASDAKLDPATQFDQIVNFINKKPDAIICDAIDSEGLIAAVDQCVAADVPFAIVDTPLTGGDVKVTVAFDNFEAGTLAGEAILKALKAKNGSEKGTVFYALGAMSSDAWRLRREGLEDVLAIKDGKSEKYDITYYADPAEGDPAKTQDFLLNRLSSGEKIDAVHAPSDNPGMGLVAALKIEKQWFTKDDPNHVAVVTVDGEPISTNFIGEGYYDYAISQDCYAYSNIVIEMLEKYTWQGQDVALGPYSNDAYLWESCEIVDSDSGPYVKIPAFEINPENCEDPRNWSVFAEKELGLPYDMSLAEV
jgi:ABC-type sugar transport system substrate-binding protein